jgi:transcriptional regulator with XRE-family HTH domain
MLPERQIKYIYEELGAKIRSARTAQGYKQGEFASLLKISRSSLVNIENGRQHSPLHNLYEIARLLKLPVKELLPELIVDQDAHDTNLDEKLYKEIEHRSAGNVEIQEKLLEFIKQQKSTQTK